MVMLEEIYNDMFYSKMLKRNSKVASSMMPIIISMLQPHSMVDLGCGQGIFCAEAKKYNVEVLGIDGDYVDRKHLLINENEFYAYDLSKPLQLNKRFDLAISLEVAEHIEPECADIFIDNLTSLSDVIVFSAAIPMQGGTNHVNEQWPSYWNRKFEERGYKVSNCLRNIFWNNKNIGAIRRQNILLFVKEEAKEYKENFIDVVHPDFYMEKNVYIKSLQEEKKLLQHRLEVLEIFENANQKSGYQNVAEFLEQKTFWELVDGVDIVQEFMKSAEFAENFTSVSLDEFETLNKQHDYIIWGAGKDGRNVKKLLDVLQKKIVVWCDEKKSGLTIDNQYIVPPSQMLEEYNGEILIIATRKYRQEIIKMLEKKMVLIYQS